MRVYLLFSGQVRSTGAPVLAYLIRAEGANILVDTGYDRTGFGPDEFVVVPPGEDVPSQLEQMGLHVDDIDFVVCTHLDPDHAGNHDVFPGAEFVIQRTHHEWAMAEQSPRLEAARARWNRSDIRFRPVDGDVTLLPGVELIESSGHVPGHQSVLLRPPGAQPILLAADAIPTTAAMRWQTRPVYPFDVNADDVRASTRKLMKIAAEEKAVVICGHEPGNRRLLRAAPDYYG